MTLIALMAAGLQIPASTTPLLLDGRCEPSEYATAARTDLGHGATLLARHDAHFLTLCIDLPADSLGTLDLYLRQPDGSVANLHISAQVGERVLREGEEPAWQFGNHRGWYGPPVAFAGMTERDGERAARFAASPGRELQLAKARFGPGPWNVAVELRALGADRRAELRWPAAGWTTMTPQ